MIGIRLAIVLSVINQALLARLPVFIFPRRHLKNALPDLAPQRVSLLYRKPRLCGVCLASYLGLAALGRGVWVGLLLGSVACQAVAAPVVTPPGMTLPSPDRVGVGPSLGEGGFAPAHLRPGGRELAPGSGQPVPGRASEQPASPSPSTLLGGALAVIWIILRRPR